jgi:hypothetical protein
VAHKQRANRRQVVTPFAFLDTLPPWVNSVGLDHGEWHVEAHRA